MTIREIRLGDEARDSVIKGINQIADAVRVTLGPQGKTVILEQERNFPRVTKDGVTVARAIRLEDHFENIGADLIREVASKADQTAGDGTTTATIIAQRLIEKGVEYVKGEECNPNKFKRGLSLALQDALDQLDEMAIDVESLDDLINIATVSANGDAEMGKLIAEAVDAIGKEGSVTIEPNRTAKDEVIYTEGLEFPQGFMSPYFMTDKTKHTAEYNEPYVLCYNGEIANLQRLQVLLTAIFDKGSSLVLVCNGMSEEVLNTLITNRLQKELKIIPILNPYHGEAGESFLDDISYITGQRPRAGEIKDDLEGIELKHLGKLAKVVVSRSKTLMVSDPSTFELEIEERVIQLKGLIKKEEDTIMKKHLKHRLAKLTGRVAVVKIGGITDLEISERIDRAEDALNACRAAKADGLVVGGGSALARVRLTTKDLTCTDTIEAYDTLAEAMIAPIKQLTEHSDIHFGTILEAVWKGDNAGYNAETCELGNLYEMGVIDPLNVVKSSLTNAVSVASLVLTTGAVVGIKMPPVQKEGRK